MFVCFRASCLSCCLVLPWTICTCLMMSTCSLKKTHPSLKVNICSSCLLSLESRSVFTAAFSALMEQLQFPCVIDNVGWPQILRWAVMSCSWFSVCGSSVTPSLLKWPMRWRKLWSICSHRRRQLSSSWRTCCPMTSELYNLRTSCHSFI